MKLENDLTFSLADYVELDTDSASPASIVDRVLQRLRAAYPRSLSRSDIAADALCGGSVAAIGKALQRLVSRGLVEVSGTTQSTGGAASLFQAVSYACDMSLNVCPTLEKPSGGLESGVGQPSDVSQPVPPLGAEDGARWDSPAPCPTPKSSDTKGSTGIKGQVFEPSPREERTAEELERLMEDSKTPLEPLCLSADDLLARLQAKTGLQDLILENNRDHLISGKAYNTAGYTLQLIEYLGRRCTVGEVIAASDGELTERSVFSSISKINILLYSLVGLAPDPD
jgi:hypothetical protein